MFPPCIYRLLSVCPVSNIFFFASQENLHRFRLNSRDAIATTNRLNSGEIKTGIREQGSRVRKKIRIDVNRLRSDVKQVVTPSE